MNTLDDIGLRHGTDKASNHHDYLSFYESFFSKLRNEPISILEVGVLEGASLRTWEEYFPNAKIVGLDLNPLAKYHQRGRIHVEVIDQSNIEELTQISVIHGPFDIIIEDGSHLWEHQITTLRTLFPYVRNSGFYIVEDLQTNYGEMGEFYKGASSLSCMDYLKCLVDTLVGYEQVPLKDIEDAFVQTYGRSMNFITFYKHSCLIRKKHLIFAREHDAGRALIPDDGNKQSIAIRMIAHVAYKGDIVGNQGFINLDSEEFKIQGFCLVTDELILEYRVLEEGNLEWGDWEVSDQFVGSRGQSKSLIGFSVRLQNSVIHRYLIRVYGRFAGSAQVVEVSNSADCRAVSGTPLCGMQVTIHVKT